MPLGYPFYLWLKNNPAAQWALGIGAAIMGFFLWLALHDRRVRKGATAKAEKKAENKSREVIADTKERTNELVEQATKARSAVPDGALADELPESVQSILFDD